MSIDRQTYLTLVVLGVLYLGFLYALLRPYVGPEGKEDPVALCESREVSERTRDQNMVFSHLRHLGADSHWVDRNWEHTQFLVRQKLLEDEAPKKHGLPIHGIVLILMAVFFRGFIYVVYPTYKS